MQWVKHPAMSLPHLRKLLWCGFDPWPGNFHVTWGQKKEKKKVTKDQKKMHIAERGLIFTIQKRLII